MRRSGFLFLFLWTAMLSAGTAVLDSNSCWVDLFMHSADTLERLAESALVTLDRDLGTHLTVPPEKLRLRKSILALRDRTTTNLALRRFRLFVVRNMLIHLASHQTDLYALESRFPLAVSVAGERAKIAGDIFEAPNPPSTIPDIFSQIHVTARSPKHLIEIIFDDAIAFLNNGKTNLYLWDKRLQSLFTHLLRLPTTGHNISIAVGQVLPAKHQNKIRLAMNELLREDGKVWPLPAIPGNFTDAQEQKLKRAFRELRFTEEETRMLLASRVVKGRIFSPSTGEDFFYPAARNGLTHELRIASFLASYSEKPPNGKVPDPILQQMRLRDGFDYLVNERQIPDLSYFSRMSATHSYMDCTFWHNALRALHAAVPIRSLLVHYTAGLEAQMDPNLIDWRRATHDHFLRARQILADQPSTFGRVESLDEVRTLERQIGEVLRQPNLGTDFADLLERYVLLMHHLDEPYHAPLIEYVLALRRLTGLEK